MSTRAIARRGRDDGETVWLVDGGDAPPAAEMTSLWVDLREPMLVGPYFPEIAS